MGGKTKQSQRTKNNVRPSSSGRSAELLSNSLKLDSSFISTGSGKVLPALFPTLTATHVDQGLTPEYAVCFKKLHKKDPITKVKALQELTELIKNGDVEDVVTALPSWANSYQTLTVDIDRRVREAVQVCHGALVAACGRRVAPQLRRLLPAWLLGAADDHGPAHAAARDSLQKTFPDGKLSEAITFCKSEILSLLIDNVTGNAEAMLSNKVEDPGERALAAGRVVCGSLQALRDVLLALPPPQRAWADDTLAAPLERDAFWKLAQHEAQGVRAAWYSCAGVACAVLPAAGRAAGRRAVRALLARREAGAAPWTALLVIADRHPDWHDWLDKRDLLVKRLLDVLESGGGGEARAVCGAARGVLRALPPPRRTRDLYRDYFDALFTGLNNKNLLSSKSERQIWISNLAECLQYLSERNDDFVVEVVTSVHRKWLENIFAIRDDQARNNLIKHSAANIASLIKSWLRQAEEKDDKRTDQIIRNCWQNIGSTVTTQIDKLSVEHKDITQSIEAHTLLIKTLKTEYLEETKPKRNIKFADEEIKEEPITIKVELDAQLTEHFKHNLEETVEKTCCYYFDFAFEKEVSQFVFPSLITLIKEFESDGLFLSLARHFDSETIYGFYDKVLRSWLSGDTMRCRTLVDIIFILVKFLSEEELDAMYNSFQEFPPQVVEWCLSPSLSLAGRGCPAGARWLRGGVAQAAVLGLARRAGDRAADDLLLDCLHAHHGEVMVGESTVVKMLEVVSSGLDDRSGRVGVVAELAAQLVAKLANTKMIDHCETVILKIYDFALRDPGGVCVCARVSLVCACAVRARALRRVSAWARQDLKELDVARLEHAASLCQYILVPDEDDLENVEEIASLTRHLFDDSFRPRVPLEVYALRCDCIFGNINCPMENDNEFIKTIVETADTEHTELSKEDLMVYVYKSMFRSFLLRTVLARNPAVMANVYFQELYGLVLYEYVVLKTLYDRYAFWHHYDLIHKTKNQLESLLDEIFEKTKYDHMASLLIYLSELAATKGYYWSYATRLLDNKVKEYIKIHPRSERTDPCDEIKVKDWKSDRSKDVLEATSIDRLKDIMTGNGFFHSLQAESNRADSTAYIVMVRSLVAAHAHEPDVLGCVLPCVLRAGRGRVCGVADLYYTHKHVMLYERDLCGAPWSQIASNAAVVDFLVESVEDGPDMSAVEWDFVNISLCSLVTSLRLSADRWECTKVSTLARPVLRLLAAVRSFVLGVPRAAAARPVSAHVAARPVSAHVAALAAEWTDIFAPDLNKNLFELLVIVLRSSDERMTSSRVAVVSSLIAATEHMNWDHIKGKTSETELDNIAGVAIGALDRMTHHAYKYLAFFTLGLISKPLVLDDAEKLAAWSAREDDGPRPQFSLALYDDALLHLQELADAALAHVPGVCGSAVVWVSAGARVSVSLLLLAAALLRHAAAARTDLAHMYVELFRENKYAEWWMQTTLRLLPPDVAAFALEECDSMPERCLEYFDELPALDVYGWCDGATVTRLSCWVLAGALGGAGAGGARGWALAAAPRTARALQRLVPAAVAPPLVRRQLTPLAERASELVDARVFVRRSGGEARCVLEVDERELELTVRFAPSHPLALPYVSTPPDSPAPDTHWIVLYLAYQNGTLLNALKMWIAAVTARVEASPQCYICYCRMHPFSGRLPTVPCHQCRNKFHTICLRKWFSTSNKSNCPLCRSKF